MKRNSLHDSNKIIYTSKKRCLINTILLKITFLTSEIEDYYLKRKQRITIRMIDSSEIFFKRLLDYTVN